MTDLELLKWLDEPTWYVQAAIVAVGSAVAALGFRRTIERVGIRKVWELAIIPLCGGFAAWAGAAYWHPAPAAAFAVLGAMNPKWVMGWLPGRRNGVQD